MNKLHISKRFRGYLPVVIDIETAGFEASTDAMLELAAITINQDENLKFYPDKTKHYHVKPFKGAILNKSCLEFNNIIPDHPFRFAISEKEMLQDLFSFLEEIKKQHNCSKCILVGHNAWFDLSFLNAAIKRCKAKSPFHSFTSIDTASLAVVFYQHTVLAQAMKKAKIPFDLSKTHSALYDTQKTAELFCKMLNQYDQ